MQRTKSIWLTLLVVMEDGSDATATDHSTFKTSKIKVSTCPGIIRSKKFINECQKKFIETRAKLLKAAMHLIHIRTQLPGQWDIDDLNTRIEDLVMKVKTTSIAARQGLNVHKFYKYKLLQIMGIKGVESLQSSSRFSFFFPKSSNAFSEPKSGWFW